MFQKFGSGLLSFPCKLRLGARLPEPPPNRCTNSYWRVRGKGRLNRRLQTFITGLHGSTNRILEELNNYLHKCLSAKQISPSREGTQPGAPATDVDNTLNGPQHRGDRGPNERDLGEEAGLPNHDTQEIVKRGEKETDRVCNSRGI